MPPVVMTVVAIAGAFVLMAVGWWYRWEPRVDYRADRRRLRRDQRRWRRVRRQVGPAELARYAVLVREIELGLRLAGQGLRSRRRTTGPVWFVRLVIQSGPARLETPFERTYLVAVEQRLDAIQAGSAAGEAPSTETDDRPLPRAIDPLVVEPL